jgi:hypothetical protein
LKPLGFGTRCATAAYRPTVRVQSNQMPATEVERIPPAIAVRIGFGPEVGEIVSGRGIGHGAYASVWIAAGYVFVVSDRRVVNCIELPPGWIVTEGIVAHVVAVILYVSKGQHIVNAGVTR